MSDMSSGYRRGKKSTRQRVGTGMDIDAAIEFARPFNNGVLVTVKRDGRPQLSNISYAINAHGEILISITVKRAKFANMQRDPRVSLHVSQPNFWGYVVFDAEARLSPVAAAADDSTVDELVHLFKAIQGEHPDWNEYRNAMVTDRRTVVHLRPTHAYGMIGN